MRDEDVGYEEECEGRVLETRVHARTIGGDRSEEQERPNLKIISGAAEINRANVVRICEREERLRERERGKRERERERNRVQASLALPRLAENVNGALRFESSSSSRRSRIWHYTSVNVMTTSYVSSSSG